MNRVWSWLTYGSGMRLAYAVAIPLYLAWEWRHFL